MDWFTVNNNKAKTNLVVAIELLIAGGFIIGVDWADEATYTLYQSYYADIVIPFGFYFLLTLNQQFVHWWQRASVIFALCTTSEILQYFGVYALARVFDPIDIVMYGIGVLLAAFVDRRIFSRVFTFWD
jgi:hypothetical protein